MKEIAIDAIKESIKTWENRRNFTFEKKETHPYKSPIVDGEYVLRFTNSLTSFFCNDKPIKISLTSRPFHTGTLSDHPLTDNPNSDKIRLDKLLADFDSDFYKEVENKLNDCLDSLTTSDPLFFK